MLYLVVAVVVLVVDVVVDVVVVIDYEGIVLKWDPP